MNETVKINGYLYHKVKNPKDLKHFLVKGTMTNSLGQKIPVTESVLHWAGSSYTGYSEHYQINICFDPKTKEHFLLVADESHFLNPSVHSHTWRRNAGKIGISFICMFDTKKFPVTEFMMILAAEAHVELAKFYNFPVSNLFDHQDYAKLDNYEGLRWDCELKLDKNETVSSRTYRYAQEYANKSNDIQVKYIKPEIVKTVIKTSTVFTDVFKEDWYSKAIEYLEQKNILEGFKENSKRLFKPTNNITRIDVARMLVQIVKYIAKQKNIEHLNLLRSTFMFNDVEVSQKDIIDLICRMGIMSGYLDNTFKPMQELTRAEFSVILFNLYTYLVNNKYIEDKNYYKPVDEEPFLDVSNKDWFYTSVLFCYQNSLLIGYKEQIGHNFKPNNKLTRAEFSATVYKFFSKILKF